MSEVMERYAPSPSSVLEGAANNASPSSASTARTASKVPLYYPPSKDVAGSLVTRDAHRIWQVAPRMSDRQFRDRQRVPPSGADQAQLRKLSIEAHLSRTLHAFDVDIGEQAWEQRVVARLSLAHDNYLRPMQNKVHEQFFARYSLQAGETWETHSVYPRCLVSLKPIHKNLIRRTRFCVMKVSTVPCDLPIDNIVPDVMVFNVTLARLPEMAEVALAMFAPELEGSQREPPDDSSSPIWSTTWPVRVCNKTYQGSCAR